MISDYRENLNRYRGIDERLDKAITFLLSEDLESIQGKIEIDGNNVYISKQEPQLISFDERKWEMHHEYADIHIGLEDGEIFGFTGKGDKMKWEQQSKDCYLSEDNVQADMVHVDRDFCVIVWPGEPHKPNTGNGTTRKLVVKVKMDKSL